MRKQIKVGGHIYEILYPYVFRESSKTIAQCDNDLREIRLRDKDGGGSTYVTSTLESVFLHELIHAIDYTYNNDTLNDDVTNRLAEGLYQVLKDNYNISLLEEK